MIALIVLVLIIAGLLALSGPGRVPGVPTAATRSGSGVIGGGESVHQGGDTGFWGPHLDRAEGELAELAEYGREIIAKQQQQVTS
jgi:hypothetical protein